MTTALVPPTTGKKKKARRVFGDVAADDLDCTLSNSPSQHDVSKSPFASAHGSMNISVHSFDDEHDSSKETTAIFSPSENKENAKNVRFLDDATTGNAPMNTIQDRFRNM